ncbi:MAG: type II toxin-antitoxin system PemK/MazF family toxin [Campylobacterota bacterium]
MRLQMTVCRGEIWLVNLNPVKKNNEMGKIRPALIYQDDLLNQSDYPTVIVIPLSTRLIDEAQPLRMRVGKRQKLQQDSDLVLTQIRAVDKSRLVQKLARLTQNELQKAAELFGEITIDPKRT